MTARQWKHGNSRGGSLGSDSDLCGLIQKPDHKLTGHTGAILSMVLDTEGRRLFSSSSDGSIKVTLKSLCSLHDGTLARETPFFGVHVFFIAPLATGLIVNVEIKEWW